MGPDPADDPYPRYRATHRAYDRRSGNFKATGWWCVFSYYRKEANWGDMEIELEVGIPDSMFDRFNQTTL